MTKQKQMSNLVNIIVDGNIVGIIDLSKTKPIPEDELKKWQGIIKTRYK